MRITVTRSGGFAGLRERIADIETTELPEVDASRIRTLVERCAFFSLPETMVGTELGADRFGYQITVREGPREHSVSFSEDDSPALTPLRELVSALGAGRNQPSVHEN